MGKILYQLLFSAVLVLVATTSATAQFAIVDNTGQPFLTKNYTDVQGSAYLYDSWKKGSVTTARDITYDGIELMYDQVEDQLIFKGSGGVAKTFNQPIKAFTLKASKDNAILKEQVFLSGFMPIDGAKPATFYEVLADGEVQLLRRSAKRIFEELPYGSATKVKAFKIDSFYYISKEGKLTKIKNDKKSVLQALSDKKTALESYIKTNKLDLKKDEELAKLITYYNTL
ncbi:hypothetical protein [Pontibacter cellulosilyticus]|uniref:Uncharacterized protein n=1 Tax=Pontibacter cellulosilyticus TaxID=1720253 RepID=A0A923N7Z1_9BACT|nr:hypothetical protein [Pontibacter cellulosilyticus]MBC5993859.1 hypothetical protein [Pontibacter cellulosilyticus]